MIRLRRDRGSAPVNRALLAATGCALAFASGTAALAQSIECEGNTVYSQLPFLPGDDWDADFSDVDTFGIGQRYFENFSADGFVCSVRIWGFMIDSAGQPCYEQPAMFDISFHHADGPDGLPGDPLCATTVFSEGVETGYNFQPGGPHGNWPLYVFDLDLGFCCPISEGWISIQALTNDSPDCWFMWIGSGDGPDSFSYVEYGDGSSDFSSLDLAMCLNDSNEPACDGDIDGDGDTDQSDLGVLLASYQVNGDGDLDGDGDTDQSDLGILLADYGCVP